MTIEGFPVGHLRDHEKVIGGNCLYTLCSSGLGSGKSTWCMSVGGVCKTLLIVASSVPSLVGKGLPEWAGYSAEVPIFPG